MQKGVILMMDERFVAEIDAAYPRLGYSDRATFIRDAVLKEMKKHGYDLPLAYKAAPPRVGKAKGGRQTRIEESTEIRAKQARESIHNSEKPRPKPRGKQEE